MNGKNTDLKKGSEGIAPPDLLLPKLQLHLHSGSKLVEHHAKLYKIKKFIDDE